MSTVVEVVAKVRQQGNKTDKQILDDFRMIVSMFFQEHNFADPEIYPDLFSWLGMSAEDYIAIESAVWFSENAPEPGDSKPEMILKEILDRVDLSQDSNDQVQIEEG